MFSFSFLPPNPPIYTSMTSFKHMASFFINCYNMHTCMCVYTCTMNYSLLSLYSVFRDDHFILNNQLVRSSQESLFLPLSVCLSCLCFYCSCFGCVLLFSSLSACMCVCVHCVCVCLSAELKAPGLSHIDFTMCMLLSLFSTCLGVLIAAEIL